MRIVERLCEERLLRLSSTEDLMEESRTFAGKKREYARRDRFPNVALSAFGLGQLGCWLIRIQQRMRADGQTGKDIFGTVHSTPVLCIPRLGKWVVNYI